MAAIVWGCSAIGCSARHRAGGDPTRLTIATVNNAEMITMQELSKEFEEQHPDIKLDWVVLEENVLRERTTTDIATRGGQFDILTIGTYETPIWGKRGWLLRQDEDLPESYDLEDVLKPVREGLTHEGKLYALPFYGESSFTYYRKDLFDKAKLKMPDQPTYEDIARFAKALNDPKGGMLRDHPSRQAGLGREHGVPINAREHVRRPLVRRGVAAADQLAGVEGGDYLLRGSAEGLRPTGVELERA